MEFSANRRGCSVKCKESSRREGMRAGWMKRLIKRGKMKGIKQTNLKNYSEGSEKMDKDGTFFENKPLTGPREEVH